MDFGFISIFLLSVLLLLTFCFILVKSVANKLVFICVLNSVGFMCIISFSHIVRFSVIDIALTYAMFSFGVFIYLQKILLPIENE